MAKDVCDVLEIVNPTRALSGLDEDEKQNLHSMKGQHKISGLRKDTILVNESGLYELIFKSPQWNEDVQRKPEAKQFKRWASTY